jgi:hypothetical protein
MGETVVVCKKCKNHDCVVDFLKEHTNAKVKLVKCQKICSGSVAGLEVAGRMEWFEHVNKPKPLVALSRILGSKKRRPSSRRDLPKVLQKRRVSKHAGRPPR